ncbi:MAG: ThiF family adenylyltransferase [Actinomycetales bacterium]|nr:ThiF family adenylyltransferase [Actinomycetales bacterium]
MTVTLRLPQAIHDELLEMARDRVETGAVLLASPEDGTGALIGTALIPVPDDAYVSRTDRALEISSDGYVHALKSARDRHHLAIWVHSHPGDSADPRASHFDAKVNVQLRELFAERTETGHYGYLIVAHDHGALTFTGSITGATEEPITTLATIGEHWSFRPASDVTTPIDFDLFDRNIRALGEQIQTTLAGLTIAVVGVGGTGSAVAEQLTRLGVRKLILIDPDTLSLANTTRVYGSTPRDVGRAKVDVLGDHLERIADGVTATRIPGAIVNETVARRLLEADIVFGCTDDNAGRVRLSRLPYYHLIPVIDCGVRLDADSSDTISGIFGRATTVYPGAACLICRDRVDLALADAEVRSIDDQQRLETEGYAPALPGAEPAVVAFTTLVAATAVSELIERLVGYGEAPTPTELLLLVHDRAVRTNIETPRLGHYCDPTRSPVGTDRDMFLGLNWAS